MTFSSTLALATLVVAGVATAADAAPYLTPAPALARQVITPVAYGYGPYHYGLYGHRRLRARRSYGTGYHGRGTLTGGPVGGLPSRN